MLEEHERMAAKDYAFLEQRITTQFADQNEGQT
jgi:hypothetical protein